MGVILANLVLYEFIGEVKQDLPEYILIMNDLVEPIAEIHEWRPNLLKLFL